MPPDALHQVAHPTLHAIVTPCPIMISHMNTHDIIMTSSITSLAHTGKAYKRCHTAPIRVHFSSSFLGWGTHICRDWHTDVLTFLESTSFKDNWLGYFLLLLWASILHGCLYTFRECSMSDAILSTSTILQDLHTFGWWLCALYSSCW